ncbi:uncharacterized protein LOC6577525 [Drosophila mojavensis]|uniref:Uncharacterized protein n=1 Tax=Drosophila mojavensis TaxID=7230 RepID=B4KEG4_DROMO|nr:uncharacterized protein LOC6577525 [Drosophila mojavensis]EDW12932.1 uncharacterized protein Dmoj_GI17940 [Drosophila mojavensis]
MDTDEKKVTATAPQGAHDEIDFTSGFETQYHKEYSPLRPKNVPPPDKRNAWFRSTSSIMMIIFLAVVFLLGTVMLVVMVFTASPLQVLLIVCAYVVIAALMIWIEVNSIKVR